MGDERLDPFNWENDINEEVKECFLTAFLDGLSETEVDPDSDQGIQLLDELMNKFEEPSINILRQQFADHVKDISNLLQVVATEAARNLNR